MKPKDIRTGNCTRAAHKKSEMIILWCLVYFVYHSSMDIEVGPNTAEKFGNFHQF